MSPTQIARAAILRGSHLLRLDAVARFATTSGSLRVMNLHGTPSELAPSLREQVAWASSHFEIVSPALCFELLIGTAPPPRRPALLFTFDDGLRSNHDVAAPVLESFGYRGLFFVNPAFAATTASAAQAFFRRNIRPNAASSLPDEHWAPMTPDHVGALHARGHAVGNHTLSHARLATVPESQLDEEIAGSAALLRRWTGGACEAFAWTFSWNAISPAAWRMVRRTHSFCFTPCPGTNHLPGTDPHMIWRTNVEADQPSDTHPFFYSGLGDPFWGRQRRWLRQMRQKHEA